MDRSATVELDAQYRVLREGSGLLAEPDRRFVRARGSEAAEYLQGQVTQDVEALEPGRSAYATLLDRKGHLQTDMRVSAIGPGELLIDMDPAGADRAIRHLSMYKIGRDVELADESSELALLRLAGPAVPRLLGDTPTGGEGDSRELELDGIQALALTTDVGIDLVCAAEVADSLAAALGARGAENVDPEAFELLRIESGRPRFGAEMTERTMPAEAGIVERAVSFTKGCYIGQETVARLHYRGRPNRVLRGLLLSEPAEAGAPVELAGKEIGRLGSFAVHPRHGAIGLAVLRREAEPGAEVEVGGRAAKVSALPFDR